MYVSLWMTVAKALEYALVAGMDGPDAKRQICAAIADRAIAVRVEIDRTDVDIPKRTLIDDNVAPPNRLSADDIDWDRSTPRQKWHTGPVRVESYLVSWSWRPRQIASLEVLTSDMVKIFGPCGRAAPDIPHLHLRKTERKKNAPSSKGVTTSNAMADVSQGLLPTRRNRGGRPPKWDWDAFIKELVRLANTVDGLPDRVKATNHMMEWCLETWGDEPAESVVREKISLYYPDKS